MAQYELNLSDYWRIIKRRRWIIFMTLVTVIGSVTVFTNLQTPIFQATATVKVEPTLSIAGVSTDQWDTFMTLNTEVKIIKSAVLAERAARILNLITPEMSEDEKKSLIGNIQSKISAERVGDTNLINISVTSSDAKETALIANATARSYIEKGMDDRSRRARELRQYIEVQLRDAETKLRKSEEELRVFTEQSGAKGAMGWLSSRLADLESRKSELLKKYTDQHPEVRRIMQQIEATEEQMKKLPATDLEYARLSRALRFNEDIYSLLSRRFKESQISEADKVQSAFIVTPALEPGSPIKPNKVTNISFGVLLGIFLGFVLALLVENLDTSIGTIEDVEKYLSLPVLGIIPHIEPAISQKKQWASLSGRNQKVSLLRSKLIVHHSGKSPFVESYHTLRTNLKFTTLKEADKTGKGKIISFTSAGIGEGKTITAANFALAAAQSGVKTLLIEADLRRPSIHWIFGLSRGPGFSDCVLGTKKWNEVIKGTTDFLMGELGTDKIIQSPGFENLSIITSGPSIPNPIDILNSPQTTAMLKDVAAHYELIILDCPPVLLFADALLVGAHATGTILMYQVGRMARRALKRAKDQLSNVNVPILGVVLNNVKTSEMGSYYGYGYYYSYKYYDQRKDSDKAATQ